MFLPLLLLIVATLAAAVVAYGTHPLWAQFPHGIELILLTRRLEWPLIAMVILLSLVLLALVVAGKWRAWWLVGLAPILALFIHHFALDPDNAFAVNPNPAFADAAQADFVADSDEVVGVMVGDDAYAYPLASLYAAPLVVQAGQEVPVMLMWSPFANRAVAEKIDRSLKARDLEIVSMPANTLLVYNSRLGQFINGVTGQTMDGRKPAGFESALLTVKMQWSQWRTLHPQTKVLTPTSTGGRKMPTRSVLPYYPMPSAHWDARSGKTVAIIATTQPAIVADDDLGDKPRNATAGDDRLLLLRDASGNVRVFNRQVKEDLFPTFRGRTFPKHPEATMVDSDSGSAWTSDGRAVDGPLKGEKLKSVEVDDQVYYDVLRVWYPQLETVTILPEDVTADETTVAPDGSTIVRHRRHRPATRPAQTP